MAVSSMMVAVMTYKLVGCDVWTSWKEVRKPQDTLVSRTLHKLAMPLWSYSIQVPKTRKTHMRFPRATIYIICKDKIVLQTPSDQGLGGFP